ncbi:amidophosphoribosyltransferase, partial [Helicobacter sp.]|uniref:amidophosphoribosyltransferase n=1 Tax=Helicobacter sp. TaxID=218 RepID=UPI00388E0748
DSVVFSRNVYEVRKNLGKQLAREHTLKADMVIPVPDSGVAAAIGYAKESGIDFELGIIRNHYVGRTFIEPTQQARELKVKLKLNPIAGLIKDKDIIVIDDSVVRGTTSKQIIKILRQAGARKIYLLVSAPPTIAPCYYGVDTPEKEQLICANHSPEEVRSFIGADYLGFLSLDGLQKSIESSAVVGEIKQEKLSYCQACFDGCYVDSIHKR